MCVGCEVTNAAGGIGTLSAMIATAFPVAGVVLLRFSRFFSLKQRASQAGYFWKLGLLLGGYHLTISLTIAFLGLALGSTTYGKLAVGSGLLLFILLWIWFCWTIAQRRKTELQSSLIIVALGTLPLLLLYAIPYLLFYSGFTHQLFLLRPILPDYSLLNLVVGFLSLLCIPAGIKLFQKL